jgi:very-short-patch-repair endonuclease
MSPSGRNRTSETKRKTNRVVRKSVGKDSGCPYCAGVKVLIGFNDLDTINPALAKEMDIEKTGFGPETVSKGSTKLAYWNCTKNHTWQATIASRSLLGHGCPECSVENSSKIEVAFRKELSKMNNWLIIDESNTKITLTHPKPKRMMVDISAVVEGKKVIIEYDGYYYHSGVFRDNAEVCFTRDSQKTRLLLDNGYHVVRIRERNLNGELDFLDISDIRLLQIHHEYKGNRVSHAEDVQNTIYEIDKWIKSV